MRLKFWEKTPPQTPTTAIVQTSRKSATRADGWENAVTGIGTARDKRIYSTVALRVLPLECYHALWKGDGISGTIVEALPEGVMRRGYTGPTDEARDRAAALGFDDAFLALMCQGRAYGGALMVLGIRDGRQPWEPVSPNGAREISNVLTITRRRVAIEAWDRDPKSATFGRPLLYRISAGGAGPSVSMLVHASRVLRWDGVEGDEFDFDHLSGWSWSVLHRPFEVIRDLAATESALASLIQDANQAVYYLKDLVQMSVSDPDTLRERMQQVDLYRSVMRALILDADGERFERTTTNFAGIGDTFDRLFSYLSAITRTPQTVLLGRSPAGMNATGDSDTRLWYDQIENVQPRAAAEMDRFYKLLDPSSEPVEFCSPWSMTEVEQEELEGKRATRDKLDIDSGVRTEEECAIMRYGDEAEREEVRQWIVESRMKTLRTPKPDPVLPGAAPKDPFKDPDEEDDAEETEDPAAEEPPPNATEDDEA